MQDAEECLRLYRDVTRIHPLKWILLLAILGVVLGGALLEDGGFRYWFGLGLVAAAAGFLLGAMLWRWHLVRKATPEELREKAIRALRSTVSYAPLYLIVPLAGVGAVILGFLATWFQGGDPVGSSWGRAAAIQFLMCLMFLYIYFVDVPRARRILESLPAGTEQAPSPAT